MKRVINEIIQEVIAEYWRVYSDMEREIQSKLIEKGISVDSVYCTGEVLNIYVYVQVGTSLFVYNKAEDREQAFLLKKYGVTNFAYNNGIAEISDVSFDIRNLPTVVLINMCVVENFPIPRLNLSTGAIAAYIRLYQRARVSILDMQLRIGITDILNFLEMKPPDLIGISVSFGQRNLSDDLLKEIQSSSVLKKSVVVVGNVIPSLYFKEFLEEYPSVIVSYAEGEECFLDLIEYASKELMVEEVRGIAYMDANGQVKKNKIDLLDISNLPFPAIDTLSGILKYKGAITLELSRGCNYSKCSFCPRAHKGGKWRSLSVDRMIKYFTIYVDVCCKLDIYPFFYIADEEFIGQLPHAEEIERMTNFCMKLKELNLNVQFDVSARVDSIYSPKFTDEQNIERLQMWAMLKEVGLHRLFLGVESGCNEQLSRYNKGTTGEQNAMAIKLITALGIKIRFGYITFDPLMTNFKDIIVGHHFIERTDVLYNAVDRDKYSLDEIYNTIVYSGENNDICLQNVPLFSKISYPLTSLEVLASTRYASMIMEYQNEHDVVLLLEADMNMARYKSGYVNKTIGLISDVCQRWIDYNFPVMYTLKGLYKSASDRLKKIIFELMEEAKTIDHYLLNFILYQLEVPDDYTTLYKFVERNGFDVQKMEGDMKTLLITALNTWQDIEAKLILKMEALLINGVIFDTNDGALQTAINNWKRSRGIWEMIN